MIQHFKTIYELDTFSILIGNSFAYTFSILLRNSFAFFNIILFVTVA